ncbi:hypothetical protein P43SY_011806 [Pythium insidiosum]|uniref:Transmembrane protein n=1 Tax=Pythium insidiosum TaxID=114742 RepID=A0AAD5LY93_PYTIN|nr:hypothetical protein P43SY_011806 [Pythium insidiosum]
MAPAAWLRHGDEAFESRRSTGGASYSYSDEDEDDGMRLTLSPTPIQFILKYEHLVDEAAETVYAQKTRKQKILSGVTFTMLSLVALYFFMVAIKLLGDGFTLALSCAPAL